MNQFKRAFLMPKLAVQSLEWMLRKGAVPLDRLKMLRDAADAFAVFVPVAKSRHTLSIAHIHLGRLVAEFDRAIKELAQRHTCIESARLHRIVIAQQRRQFLFHLIEQALALV